MKSRADSTGWLPTLDGWRAVAISLVVWHHATMSVYAVESAYWAESASQLGSFGVDIFFGLSGLLITTLLLRGASEGRVRLRDFYIRRAFRILPPLFTFLLAAVALGRIGVGWELLSSVLLFRNYLPADWGGHTSGHLWSLSIEEHFYLLWPAVLALIALPKIPRLVTYAALGVGMWRLVDEQYHYSAAMLGSVPSHFRTDLRLDALLWGCFASFLLHDPKTRDMLRTRAGGAWFAGVLAVVVGGIVLYSLLTSLWIAMLIPVLLVLTLLHPEWTVSRALDLRPVRFVGRISYSLYLWQQLFLVPGWLPEVSGMSRFPLNLALAFGAAVASYYWVERPCMAYGRKVADRLREGFGLPGALTNGVAGVRESA